MKEYREFPPKKGEPLFPEELGDQIAGNAREEGKLALEFVDKVEKGVYRKEVKNGHVSVFDDKGKRVLFTDIGHYATLEKTVDKKRSAP